VEGVQPGAQISGIQRLSGVLEAQYRQSGIAAQHEPQAVSGSGFRPS